ncbi:pre-mRNA processing RNA-helicase [Apophysomyces ossiformis]|uniref:RNA helicase n=1 Tax=Apophysomyces ossiformis TaxID=679940 RepID=A0A8H7BYD5_9FUNG|nr:pre-mRNA processing RNA-helicase [Apophysomyces ossiformis]
MASHRSDKTARREVVVEIAATGIATGRLLIGITGRPVTMTDRIVNRAGCLLVITTIQSYHTPSPVRTESARNDGSASTETGHGIGEQMEVQETSTQSLQPSSSTASPSGKTAATEKPQIDREEIIRQRRERIEEWKREKEAKAAAKKAEEEAQKAREIAEKAEADIPKITHTEEEASNVEINEEITSEVKTDTTPNVEDSAANDEMEMETSDDELPDRKESADVKMTDATGTILQKEESGSATEGVVDLVPKVNGAQQTSPAKPRNTMRIGFGLKKNLMMKKSTVAPKKPEPMEKVPIPEPKVEEKEAPAEDNDEEVDPLEAYMMDVTAEARKISEEDKKRMQQLEKSTDVKRASDDEEGEGELEPENEEIGSDPEDILALAAKKAKRKDLAPVDHAQVEYESFRKDFYIEPPELREMTPEQVELLRIELDGIKIRGVNCPKPIMKWTHCGLPAGCLEVIRRLKFEKPTAIQAQAIPAIMNGRDVIGVAKTGSGKTIAFLLPMFRHIKDQRPLEMGEGPIGVIMTPTRELATQIHRECKPFLKVLGLRAVCAYGGSPIKDQIADLKRGCEIIVCTPGRMIDLLCANSGRVTNLRRVTYLVLDEADRMFDMGFEPQVMKIVNNVQPNRQTVLFSATFPRQMEALARKVLKKPLEITVGGRSVVCSDVEQIVEVREDSTKFVRLLEILGQFFNTEDNEDSRALIFVDRQEAADNLLRDLLRRGHFCQSLHGGKDQADRDSTISDFKSGVTNILIATSVAARGLDVKQLKLVVNYECPNHMEDYVHRVGRTGRAGNKGTAYTFITSDQDRYAMDICKALKLSGQEIPNDLQALADTFQEKVKTGKERMASSGFGGKGLERLDKDRDLVKKIQKRAYGGDDMEESDEEEIELETRVVSGAPTKTETPPAGPVLPGQAAAAAAAARASAAEAGKGSEEQLNAATLAAKKAAAEVAARINAMAGQKGRTAHDIIADINARFSESAGGQQMQQEEEGHPVYAEEIVINDYPQKARWKVTNKEQISQITEISGAAITTRGTFFPPGKQPGPNERKLYLFIEGDSELVVEKAKNEIKRILVEATVAQMEAEARTGGGTAGRYSVV